MIIMISRESVFFSRNSGWGSSIKSRQSTSVTDNLTVLVSRSLLMADATQKDLDGIVRLQAKIGESDIGPDNRAGFKAMPTLPISPDISFRKALSGGEVVGETATSKRSPTYDMRRK